MEEILLQERVKEILTCGTTVKKTDQSEISGLILRQVIHSIKKTTTTLVSTSHSVVMKIDCHRNSLYNK